MNCFSGTSVSAGVASITDTGTSALSTWSSQRVVDEIAVSAQKISNEIATLLAADAGSGGDGSNGPVLSTIDMSTELPLYMVAPISESTGGINRCWGHTTIHIAGINLLAGRCVALQDQNEGSDGVVGLKVCYLKNGDELMPSISPIGITQHNCLAGEKITVCTLGYTTVICENSDIGPERGSQIISDTQNAGKVRINNTAGGNQGRMGFLAQSDRIVPNSAILIYYAGWYQPF